LVFSIEMMYLTSLPVSAYLRRLRSRMISGRHSRSLWGPVDGRGAQTPPSLSSIQCLGAFKRFRCILGPRAMAPAQDERLGLRVAQPQERR
jgi:hypothetical protein